MFQHDLKRAFILFKLTFVFIILIASLKTIMEAIGVSNWALFTLAGAEVIAVILFVFPKFTKRSGIALMIIFGIAITLSWVTGILMEQLHLIVYLACAYFIVVHDRELK